MIGRLLLIYQKLKPISSGLPKFKTYSTYIEKELEVPIFCDIHIDLPYSVRVKPFNVRKYHNLDKLIIEYDERCEDSLKFEVNGNQVKILETVERDASDIVCNVKAPVKANLYINSKKDINVGFFHGDKLHLTSSEGNINVNKYQGNSVDLTCCNGDINLTEFTQASNIIATILEKGSINSGRLQGLNIILKTNNGNISVESSYAYESHYEIVNGNFDLHNIHKACKIFLGQGHINLTGFDGKLKVVSEEASADIHLSRITEDSEINILNGTLNLKVADACQDYIQFKIKAKSCEIAENVKMTAKSSMGIVILTPDLNDDHLVLINCLNGPVMVESASWQDMIKQKLKK